MLGEGLDSAQVAEELFITRRGGDYHLDVLKGSLNAVNRNHLLIKECALNIVDLKMLF
ncbi:hypothetical protein [uncultured Shewanella sp.]|uniref:hypothetical protein n=1 Tax=uncultured Shewanella sp. TaxID=173975 RepID=UPI002620F65F|nr:hypothetical protein [uncultured Shewanella sp.]